MINARLIKKYYDKRAACQVLGTLMKEPHRLLSQDCQLVEDDFVTGLHEIIYVAVFNLAQQGVKEITVSELEGYLATASPINYNKIFEDTETITWLNNIIDDANPVNYTYYYQKVRKMTLLRRCLEQGIIISDILDVDELDPVKKQEQQEKFDAMTIEEVLRIYDRKIITIKNEFIRKDASESRKAGDNAIALYHSLQESPAYGLSLESKYINTITRAMQKGHFFLETRDTGTGKTRVAIERLLGITAPYLWDFEAKQFIKNPQGGNSGLYVGTEMNQYTELEPMMWAFVSGVSEDKIKDSNLTTDENERVQRAIEILQDTKLFLEHNPNFGTQYLWQTIEEYKKQHDIYAVMLDYIELNATLISEFTSNTKGMGVREDQILLDLSAQIKTMAEDIDVCIMAYTQTTDEARRDNVRDQRAVKGARALPNKSDVGLVTFEPTRKELDKIDPIVARKGIVKHKYPNICYSFYKNRFGIQEFKDIKVWGYQDLGTMEYEDMFCTDKDYKLININPTTIVLEDDKIQTV